MLKHLDMRDLCIFLLFCSVSCLLFDLVPGKSHMGKSPILLVEVLYSYGVYITLVGMRQSPTNRTACYMFRLHMCSIVFTCSFSSVKDLRN